MNDLNKMEICPFLTGKTIVEVDGKSCVGKPVECIHEGCAWWVEDRQRCAVAVIANSTFVMTKQNTDRRR